MKTTSHPFTRITLFGLLCLFAVAASGAPANQKLLLLAGPPSHGPGEHEHRAGLLLFQKCLTGFPGLTVEVQSVAANGWVQDEQSLNGVAAIVVFSSGAGGHPFLRPGNLEKLEPYMAKGVGFGTIHWATEPTLERGHKEFIAWSGGSFEVNYSVNPVFIAEFKDLPQHPVTRGVKPFTLRDEWYYHIRFPDGMKGVTAILSPIVPESSLNRPTAPRIGLREGNEHVWASVRNHEPQPVMWVTERSDGGRGFGFTGGHYHTNWGNADNRKLMLNALVWVAKVEVPANGVESRISPEDLQQNLDPKGGRAGGAAAIPNLTATQTAALANLEQSLATLSAAVTAARLNLVTAQFAEPRSESDLAAKLEALRNAEMALANLRAEQFSKIQESADRLDPAQVQALTVQGIRGTGAAAAGGTRAGAPATPAAPVPSQ